MVGSMAGSVNDDEFPPDIQFVTIGGYHHFFRRDRSDNPIGILETIAERHPGAFYKPGRVY